MYGNVFVTIDEVFLGVQAQDIAVKSACRYIPGLVSCVELQYIGTNSSLSLELLLRLGIHYLFSH